MSGSLAFRRVVLAVAAWLAATLAAPARAGDPGLAAVSEAGSPLLFTLTCDNGLAAVVDGRPGSRTVFLQIGVRVGSRDEPERLAGMSHLLEHLLFKEGHGPGARRNPAFSALRAAGGLVNASTDFELTEYHADVPSGRFEEGWDALVALVTGAAFDTEDVEREKEVVLQEAALGKADPLAIVAYSVLGRIFPGDPIGQPVIGFRRTLRRIHLDDLERYRRGHYVPANLFAVIVGDVEPARAAARVRQTLCSMPPGGTERPAYDAPAPRLQPLYRFRTLVKQAYLLTGSLTRGGRSLDATALDLLSIILSDGRTSRLHRRLVRQERLTDEVLTLTIEVSNTGAFGAGLAVDPGNAGRARGALMEELERLAREPVTDAELEIARALLRGRLALQFETNGGIAEFRSRRMLLHQPVGRDELLAQLDRIRPEDLVEAAARHWGPGAASGPIEVQVLPARGFGKVIAALRFLIFRRL